MPGSYARLRAPGGIMKRVPVALFFRKRLAIPQEHGSWVFLLLPLLVGMRAAGRPTVESAYLFVVALAVFFMRQPLLALTKVRAGRRPRTDLPAAWTWLLLYGFVAALHVYGLVLRGHADVLRLGIPAALIAAWHAWLVRHRAERRQELMEILAAGALALSAPAAVIVAQTKPTRGALLALWIGTWIASASMIVCTYLRLSQRRWPQTPALGERLRRGAPAILLPALGLATPWLWPFGILLIEALLAAVHPARGARPRAIGWRQLAVSVLVTVAFLLSVGG